MSQVSLPRFLTRKGVPLWRDVVVLKWVAQILSAVLVVGFLAFFISNVLKAAEARGLGLGYGFLDDSAGFPVAESVIPYDPSRSFGYALLVGLLNTCLLYTSMVLWISRMSRTRSLLLVLKPIR